MFGFDQDGFKIKVLNIQIAMFNRPINLLFQDSFSIKIMKLRPLQRMPSLVKLKTDGAILKFMKMIILS